MYVASCRHFFFPLVSDSWFAFSLLAAHVPIIGVDVWEHVRSFMWFVVVIGSITSS